MIGLMIMSHTVAHNIANNDCYIQIIHIFRYLLSSIEFHWGREGALTDALLGSEHAILGQICQGRILGVFPIPTEPPMWNPWGVSRTIYSLRESLRDPPVFVTSGDETGTSRDAFSTPFAYNKKGGTPCWKGFSSHENSIPSSRMLFIVLVQEGFRVHLHLETDCE